MSDETDLVGIMQPSSRVRSLRRALDVVTERLQPVLDLSRPYVDGLENLPPDGRFLLVGNHTQFGSEVFLIPDMVRRSVGTRVRPLADRNFGRLRRLA
ncbi:glycerol acyltransferase, partial [Mycobacterium intracellulare subsp. chimaera]